MKMTRKRKLWMMFGLLMVGLIAVAVVDAINARASLIRGRVLGLQQQVQTAVSIAESWRKLAESKQLSDAEARSGAMAALRVIRFGPGQSGYIGIYDSNIVRVLNPTDPKLEGQSASGSVDSDGKRVVVEVVKSTAPGGNHVTQYKWPKPGQKIPLDKVVYSDTIPQWDWHVYTGAYLDDIEEEFRLDLARGLAAVVVIGLALSVAMLVLIRGVQRSLGGEPALASAVAHEISRGNLAVHIPQSVKGDSSLMGALSEMRAKLSGIIQGIHGSGEAIAIAAAEVADGSEHLAERTEEQAASLEQTSASMQEFTSSVQNNEIGAKKVTELVGATSGSVRQCGETVEQVVEQMRAISESSGRVSEIIAVIEGIAFQTNILALNAAVEAARAGENGRGFAVVAGEVRALAQRSALAAKEVKELIAQSTARITSGSEIASNARESMSAVVSAIDGIHKIVEEIARASSEQAAGIAQVNQAISQMDATTQENAALVEQSSSAARTMADHASAMMAAVSVFRLTTTPPAKEHAVDREAEAERVRAFMLGG